MYLKMKSAFVFILISLGVLLPLSCKKKSQKQEESTSNNPPVKRVLALDPLLTNLEIP